MSLTTAFLLLGSKQLVGQGTYAVLNNLPPWSELRLSNWNTVPPCRPQASLQHSVAFCDNEILKQNVLCGHRESLGNFRGILRTDINPMNRSAARLACYS